MDLTKIASTLLSSDSISGLTQSTGASGSDITSVLSKALPSLLKGANEQATNKKTSESFVNALSQHAKDDTKDLSGFLGNVDLSDGAKIIGHLLGSDKEDVVNDIAKETGVSKAKTNSILSAIAPLLMSLLGQQTEQEDNGSDIGNLVGSLLSNVDVGDLLTGLLGDNSSSDGKKKPSKKKKTSSKDSGNIISGLMNLLK